MLSLLADASVPVRCLRVFLGAGDLVSLNGELIGDDLSFLLQANISPCLRWLSCTGHSLPRSWSRHVVLQLIVLSPTVVHSFLSTIFDCTCVCSKHVDVTESVAKPSLIVLLETSSRTPSVHCGKAGVAHGPGVSSSEESYEHLLGSSSLSEIPSISDREGNGCTAWIDVPCQLLVCLPSHTL